MARTAIIGFSPIPAMSMVSYAAGSRYLSLIGGVCLSFYDWYCDLPPVFAADLGRADRRARKCRLVQFQLPDGVGFERSADPHARRALLYRGALQGHQERRDLLGLFRGFEVWRPLDRSRSKAPTPLSRWRWATSSSRNFMSTGRCEYFADYARQYTDMPMSGAAGEIEGRLVPDGSCAPRISPTTLGETNNPEWKTVAYDEITGEIVVPHGVGRLPLGRERASGISRRRIARARRNAGFVSRLPTRKDELADVAFPYFGNREHDHFAGTDHPTCSCARFRRSASR